MANSKKLSEPDQIDTNSTRDTATQEPFVELETDPRIAEIRSKILDTKENLEAFLEQYPNTTLLLMHLEKVRVAFKVPPYLQIFEDGTVVDTRGSQN